MSALSTVSLHPSFIPSDVDQGNNAAKFSNQLLIFDILRDLTASNWLRRHKKRDSSGWKDTRTPSHPTINYANTTEYKSSLSFEISAGSFFLRDNNR